LTYEGSKRHNHNQFGVRPRRQAGSHADGQYVAFWLNDFKTGNFTLAILDTQTGVITDTCIQAGSNPFNVITSPFAAWSPDGKSLVVAANFRPEDNGKDVVLVDLEKQVICKITTNNFPVGWLVSL
jgi:hypothetical protein